MLMIRVAQATNEYPWYQFVSELDWLINDIDYVQAAPALLGLREYVLTTRRVNEAQRRSVENIRATYGAA